jgi:hypothetical protein
MPLQAWTSPYGSRRLRLPEFLDSWHLKVGRLSALCPSHLHSPEDILNTHIFRGLVNSKTIVWLEGVSK